MSAAKNTSLRIGILITLAVAINLPLVWTILASFGVMPDNTVHPPVWIMPPTLDHYLDVVTDPNLVRELITSAGISLASTLLCTGIAFLAAYSLARARFRGRRLLVQCFLILASLPVISYVAPLWDTMLRIRLYDTFPGIVLSETALCAPLAVYVLFGYLTQVSIELEESARLDGATLWQILGQIVLPITAPSVAATAIIVLVLTWNQLLIPLVITARYIQTLPVMLSDWFTYERELTWETAAVALIVSVLPLFVFVAAAHRLLERFSLSAAQNTD